MGTATKIEWTDNTFNPWRGCAKVHTGCANCYAEREAKRFPDNRGIWGPNGTRVLASDAKWREPLKWNRDAEKAGERTRVFCASLADIFEDWQGNIVDVKGKQWHQCDSCVHPNGKFAREAVKPLGGGKFYEHGCGEHFRPLTLNDVRTDLFKVIDDTPRLDWQILTKRPENIRKMWPTPIAAHLYGSPGQLLRARELSRVYGTKWHAFPLSRPNVQLLYSASDQETFDSGYGHLIGCGGDLAPVIGLSLEPLIGPIVVPQRLLNAIQGTSQHGKRFIDWVIVGGESGTHARPCDIEWIRSIVAQCKAAGVACFVKQLGANVYDSAAWEDGNQFTSYQQWVNKAGSWLGGVSGGGYRYKKPEKAVCVDAAGRRCKIGSDFMRAEADGTFPVKWHYLIDVNDKGGDIEDFPAEIRVREFPRIEVASA